MSAAYVRRSWRRLAPGDRLYDPHHGNPAVLLVVPTARRTRRRNGPPGWLATASGPWRMVPRAGMVKVLR